MIVWLSACFVATFIVQVWVIVINQQNRNMQPDCINYSLLALYTFNEDKEQYYYSQIA